jgi:hypothetical protein
MRKALLFIAILATTIGFLNSCSKSDDDTPGNTNCQGVTPSFSADVNPIIQTFCNQPACHNSGSINGPGPLTNHAQVFAARTSIRDQVAAGLMPQNTTLTSAQKQTIICWVNNGAPNN